jgi:DNA-binding IclR family transcriptional regulator
MLGILDLFTVDNPVWSTPDILDTLESSRSTGYRYIRALTSAGLLSAVGNGYYVLGPRIIELDFQIRETDPLLQASAGVLEELVEATGHSALLCTLFQNTVICVRECRAQLSPTTLIDRGQQRPLFQGAMSKVILAHLSFHRLKSIFDRRRDEIREANLGESWKDFRNVLGKIRSDGYFKSAGEYTPGMVGVGAPVFNAEEEVIGSVGVAWDMSEMSLTDVDRVILSVRRAGKEISQRMASRDVGHVYKPRAVG